MGLLLNWGTQEAPLKSVFLFDCLVQRPTVFQNMEPGPCGFKGGFPKLELWGVPLKGTHSSESILGSVSFDPARVKEAAPPPLIKKSVIHEMTIGGND